MTEVKDRPLSEAERARLEKFKSKQLEKFKNKRGRRNPAKIPARLARTAAFAPKKGNLITDSNFERLYVVPGHSVIRVTGRELGTQHRDAIYALFRLPRSIQTERVADTDRKAFGIAHRRFFVTLTTWRELLRAMGKTEHVNNLMTLMNTFGDIKQVLFAVMEGEDQAAIIEAWKRKDLTTLKGYQGRGGFKNMLDSIDWNGLELDSDVEIRYGDWTANMISSAKLVSLNADIQFKLKSDYAKTFWPYIDSMNNHIYVDEDILAALAGRDLWGEDETKLTRGQFRRETKNAFEDMKKQGGLTAYRVEETGVGRRKSRRYFYTLANPSQLALPL